MRNLLLATAMALAATAHADTVTSRMGLVIPSTGTFNWGIKLNADLAVLDSSAAVQQKSNTFQATSSNTFNGPVLMSSAVVVNSTATILGNAFSVGGSTFVVAGGNVGIDTPAPATKLHMSSGTLTIDGTGAKAAIGDGPAAGNVTQMQFNGSVGAGDRKSIIWNQPGVGTEAQMDMKYFSPDTAFVWGHLYNGGVQTSDLMILRGGGSPATLDVNGSAQFGTTAKSTITVSGNLQIPNNTAIQALDSTKTLRNMAYFDGSNRFQFGDGIHDIDLDGGTATSVRIAGGNFGIGVTTPSARLDVNGQAEFGSGVKKSTFGYDGGLTLADGSAVTLSGSAGVVTTASSVTASAFFGDASHMTGLGGIAPTRQVFLSGSGTYTTPANARHLVIRMVAGGGGGGAATTNAGSNGNSTEFGTIFVSSGLGGAVGGATTGGGAGGTGGQGGSGVFVSSAVFRIAGGGGTGGDGSIVSAGGNSALGGGARTSQINVTGASGATNSGGGGAGGYDQSGSGQSGGGGGAGEYAELTIDSPAGTYPYIVGAGGAGGTAGVRAGGSGGSGIIIVDEYY